MNITAAKIIAAAILACAELLGGCINPEYHADLGYYHNKWQEKLGVSK